MVYNPDTDKEKKIVARVLRYKEPCPGPYFSISTADTFYAFGREIEDAERFAPGVDICEAIRGVCELPGDPSVEDVTPEWLEEYFDIETWEFTARKL